MEDTYRLKTIEAGASTTVWAAVSQDLNDKGGLYLENCVISKEINDKEEIRKNMFGYLPYAFDQDGVDKLWEISEKIVNIK